HRRVARRQFVERSQQSDVAAIEHVGRPPRRPIHQLSEQCRQRRRKVARVHRTSTQAYVTSTFGADRFTAVSDSSARYSSLSAATGSTRSPCPTAVAAAIRPAAVTSATTVARTNGSVACTLNSRLAAT